MWKITDIHAENECIVWAKYHVEMDGIGTEGYFYFDDPKIRKPFAEVTEEDVIAWIQTESKGEIEKRLKEQANNVQKKVIAPWMPQVFVVGE